MKHLLKFAAYILLTGTVFFVACIKEEPNIPAAISSSPQTSTPAPTPPQPPPVITKIKGWIMEYGTDRPLPGVTVDGWLRTGSRFHVVTDTSGKFSFDGYGNEFGLGMITKAGYWTVLWNINFDLQGYYLNAPITFFPGNVSFDYYSGYISSCDSLVVKLFPKKYITIHIKDSLGVCTSGDCNVIFTANALFTQQGTNQAVVQGDGGIPNEQNSWFTRLWPHIDTTFQYPVCGNTVNTFTIGDYASDSGWFSEYLHRDTIFISNSSNMTLNITY